MVSNGKAVSTPLMTLDEYMRLIVMVQTKTPATLKNDCETIVKNCSLEEWGDVKLKNIPPRTLKMLNFYISIYLDADLYVFDTIFSMGTGAFKILCDETVERISTTKTTVVISSTYKNLPITFDKAMVVHEGEKLFFGDYEEAIQVYSRLNHMMENSDNNLPCPERLIEIIRYDDEEDDLHHEIELDRNIASKLKYATTYPPKLMEFFKRLSETNKKIIIGPYLSDIGFEILYWIPFVRWIMKEFNVKKENTIVISRYGTRVWYSDITKDYVDILELMDEPEFEKEQAIRIKTAGNIKQFTVSEFEKNIINEVLDNKNMGDYELLHPSTMYKLFTSVWNQTFPINYILDHLEFKNITDKPDTAVSLPCHLPQEFIAVRLDNTAYIPATPQTTYMVKLLVEKIADRMPVVLLNNGIEVDFHKEWAIDFDHENIFKITGQTDRRQHFFLQTQIMQKASGFFGTHGGASYLAALCDIPSLTFYLSEIGAHYPVHLKIFESACDELNSNEFKIVRFLDLEPDLVLNTITGNKKVSI